LALGDRLAVSVATANREGFAPLYGYANL